MKIERTAKRIHRTITVAHSPDHLFNSGAGNPAFYDHPVHIGLGYDVEGRSLELRLTVDEAKRMAEALLSAVKRVEALFSKETQ